MQEREFVIKFTVTVWSNSTLMAAVSEAGSRGPCKGDSGSVLTFAADRKQFVSPNTTELLIPSFFLMADTLCGTTLDSLFTEKC